MSVWGTTYVGKFSSRAFIISKKPTKEKYIISEGSKNSYKCFLGNLQAPKAERDLIIHQFQPRNKTSSYF